MDQAKNELRNRLAKVDKLVLDFRAEVVDEIRSQLAEIESSVDALVTELAPRLSRLEARSEEPAEELAIRLDNELEAVARMREDFETRLSRQEQQIAHLTSSVARVTELLTAVQSELRLAWCTRPPSTYPDVDQLR